MPAPPQSSSSPLPRSSRAARARGSSGQVHARCTRRDGAGGRDRRAILGDAGTTQRRGQHAQAWLAVARTDIAEHTASDAVAAAARASRWSSERYRPKGVKDDTGMHLLDAEAATRAGRTEEAATRMIDILDARISLYFKRYEAEVRRAP